MLTGEQPAKVRMMDVHAAVFTGGHDPEQRLQRRAGILETAVMQITQGHSPLRLDQIVDAVDIAAQVLQFGLEHRFVQHRGRGIEDGAAEAVDEMGVDPVAEAAGEYRTALVLKILQPVEETLVAPELC